MNLLDDYRLVRFKYVKLHKCANNLIQLGLDHIGDSYGTQIADLFEKAYGLSKIRREVLELRKKVFLRRKK